MYFTTSNIDKQCAKHGAFCFVMGEYVKGVSSKISGVRSNDNINRILS